MGSRETILNKLRGTQAPFAGLDRPEPVPVTPLDDTSPDALLARFVKEAEALHCQVHQLTEDAARDFAVEMVGGDERVLCWQAKHIPISKLHTALRENNITVAKPDDGSVRVGITGVDAALATTGSLVLCSGPGKFRGVSLLPDVHLAVMTPDQLLPDFETFVADADHRKTAFKDAANTTIISGPSKTADIGQELILGAHGPRAVHIVIVSG